MSERITEPGTPHDKQWLQECCELVKNKMPENYSFVVFAFPTHGSDRVYYAANATRESAVSALKRWLKYADGADADGTWAKHVTK